MRRQVRHTLTALGAASLILSACAPAPAQPTAAPPPPPTAAAKPTSAPAPTSAPTAAPKPTTAPAAAPAATIAAQPAAKPTAAATKPAAADDPAVAQFYSGKTIRIIVGSAAGGGFDFYARTLARYLPQYIPGSPTVIVENKGGASGDLVAANSVYSSEPKDGTVIGTFAEGLVLRQVIGGSGVQFDSAKYQWLGAATKGAYGCVARTDSGVSSIQDTLNGKQLIVGTASPGTDLYGVPVMIQRAMGANFKLVEGYGGAAPLILATESKEIDGFCATLNVVIAQAKSLLGGEQPTARFILVTGSKTPDTPLLKGVPSWEEAARTDEARRLLRASDAHRQMSKPYAVAPEVPAARVAALRKAIAAAFADPKMIAEVEKGGQDVIFSNGEEVQAVVQELFALPADLRSKLAELLK